MVAVGPRAADGGTHPRTRRTLAATACVGAAKGLSGVAILATNLWVARHLEPAAYGAFAFAATCVLLIDGVLGSAFDAAVLRYATAGAPSRLGVPTPIECAAVLLKAVLALGAGAVVCALRRPAAMLLLHDPAQAPVLVLAVAAGGGVLLVRSIQVHFQIRHRIGRYSAVELTNAAVRTVAILSVLALGVRSAAPIVGAMAAAPAFVVAAVATASVPSLVRAAWTDRAAWQAVVRFSSVAAATCGVGAIVARLDVLVLAVASTPAEVGVFGLASLVALSPMLLGAYMSPALTPHIVPLAQEGRLLPFFVRTQAAVIAAGIVVVVGGAAVLPSLIGVAFPATYAPAVPVVQVLLLSGAAGLVTFPMTLHLLLFFRPRFYVGMDLASLPLLLAAYAWAARHHGALGVAWITAGANVAKAAIAQIAAVRITRGLTPARACASADLAVAPAI